MKKECSYKERVRKRALVPLKQSNDRELVLPLQIALGVLVLATLLAAIALHLTEGQGVDSPFSHYWNCLLWVVMTYLGHPSAIGDWAIATSGGQIVAVVIKIIAIAFFAAFTGLLVALITGWYKRIVYRAKIDKHHKELLKAFHRQFSKSLKDKTGHSCYVVPSQRSLAMLQVNATLGLKDVVEVANKYYGFRIQNLANIYSIEDSGVTDRFIVEHFPVNREYGCCLDRDSNVTIVSPASDRSVGTGWFAYYIALLGGFNYISKDYDTDPLHRISYYNISNDVEDDDALRLREAYRQDLEKLCSRENAWAVFILSTKKSKSNENDIHLSCALANEKKPTVRDMSKYLTVVKELQSQLNKLRIQYPSIRFPLLNNNVIYAYKLQEKMNSFTMRISSRIQKADTERLPIAATIAEILKQLAPVRSDKDKTQPPQDLIDKKTETYCSSDWI